MVKTKMAEHLKAATQFIEQGHVRVGPELVKDPAFLVPRFGAVLCLYFCLLIYLPCLKVAFNFTEI